MDSGALAPPGPTVPSVGRRLLAMLYESLMMFAVAFFAGLAFYGATHGWLSGNTRLLFQLYLFLVLGAYFIACWSGGGRTLPMQTWKMRVVRSGPSLSLFGVGVFWAFFDRDRQFLHDRLAGTRIVATGNAGAGHR